MDKLKMQVEQMIEVLNTGYDGAEFTEYVNTIYESLLEIDLQTTERYSKLLMDITEYIDADRGQVMVNVENVVGMILGLVVILSQTVLFLRFTLKNMKDGKDGR